MTDTELAWTVIWCVIIYVGYKAWREYHPKGNNHYKK